MPDLSTLDATKPADGDPVNTGASRMREERTAILTSFGVEHALGGIHKFLIDTFGSLPAAGNAGRIAIDTTIGTQQLYLDNGTDWQTLHAAWAKLTTDATAVPLPATLYTNVLTDSITLNTAMKWLGLFAINITKNVDPTVFAYRIMLNGVEAVPISRRSPTYASSIVPDSFTYYTWAYSNLNAGANAFAVQVNPSANAAKSYCAMLSLLF